MPSWTLYLAVGLFLWRLTSFVAAGRIGRLVSLYLDEAAASVERSPAGQSNDPTASPA